MGKNRKSKNNAPAKIQSRKTQITQTKEITNQFSGPIPPPALLQQYNDLLPGAAERILKMAENEADHSHEIEKLRINYQYRQNRRGQIAGLIVTFAAFASAIIALFLGYPDTASVLGGATVVSLVAVFITGKIYKD